MKILSSINYYIIIEKYIHTVIVFAWVAVVIVLMFHHHIYATLVCKNLKKLQFTTQGFDTLV